MALKAPRLDDRHFQDLVDEAKKRIPYYSKEWTDHNVSDPGVTLIELFAWMTDILLYRLNQVPDLHYIKFMEMLGIRLRGPVSAKAPVTFWMAAPQPTPVVIPAGTELSSTQTETETPVIFTTDRDFRVTPPQLNAVLARVSAGNSTKKSYREQNLRRLETGFEGFEVFSPAPQLDDALYFGFENDLSDHILGLELDFDPAGGTGIDPTLPPYQWEASTGRAEEHWERCEVEIDTTRGMNATGRVRVFLPRMGRYKVNNQELYWVRARVREITPAETREGMRPYRVTPRLRQAAAASWGGTTTATHARTIQRELLGQSDGSPGQRFFLKFTPLLERQAGERLSVLTEGAPLEAWKEVADFASSGAADPHYILDSLSGELRFGPAVRQPDGTIKLYGAIPPRNAQLIFERYSYGGGQSGNVQENILNTLKTAIPYIARVANRQPAWGGLDAETLEDAMLRAPALLSSGGRAVTESDFEFLARQALPAAIGRVKCLQPASADAERVIPGQVYLLVIPRLPSPEGYLDPAQLAMDEADIKALGAYLEERRLLTTHVNIRPPAYTWVAARVELRAAPGADPAKVEKELLARLYRFLNPLTGGPDGHGWPFGRALYLSDVYQCLQGTPEVFFIRNVSLYTARPGGDPTADPLESLEIVAHGVIASGRHAVKFI